MSAQKKKFPLFSIITVNLNHLEGLKRTCASVEAQDHSDYEWIVIDGGSQDGSLDFLHEKRKHANKTGWPFTFISEKDNGPYDAMNIGVARAKGRYLIFMNSGDCFADEKTLSIIAGYTEKKPDFIYGDALETAPKGKIPRLKPARSHKDIALGMFTHHQAMVYNRLKIRDWDMHYSLLYTIASDYDFTARFLEKTENIVYINEPLCIFETGGLSQKNALLGRREQYMVREKLEMVRQVRNVWIFIMQSIAWFIKTRMPWLYHLLKKQK